MFCVNCGKQIKEEWKLCPFCGYNVSIGTKNVDNNLENAENDIVDEQRAEELEELAEYKKTSIGKKMVLMIIYFIVFSFVPTGGLFLALIKIVSGLGTLGYIFAICRSLYLNRKYN